MLSESQERMVIVARKEHVQDVAALFERWEVPWAVIGHVTNDQRVRLVDGDQEVADLPVDVLVDAPEYTREGEPAAELFEMERLDLSGLPEPTNPTGSLLRLLASPNIASKRWIYRQYDQSVLNNTVVEAGSDAAVLRIKGTHRGIAVATDGNGRYCHIDPYRGGAIAVAEAARNVVCSGALPVAVTDCLNFGNPERPDVYFQMQGVIQGIADACDALGTPVISGNVSLYNETGGRPVYPTPVIGVLGILDDVNQRCGMGFRDEGDEVFVVGASLDQTQDALGGSEYIKLEHGLVGGKLEIDLQLEGRVHRAVLAGIKQGAVTAAHDCSDGGLAVALAEMCIAGDKGLDASAAAFGGRIAAALFGEAQSRIIVSVKPGARDQLLQIASGLNVPVQFVGRVTGEARLRLGGIDASVEELRSAYEGGLAAALGAT
jgi:phosphoribosylformylglycinamidine synthase